MTNRTMRAGIVGAGYISDFHRKAIINQNFADLVGVCDLSEQAANKLAAQCPGAKVYTDLEKMLSEARLDVVHILTQPDSHAYLARKIIKAGCHVIMEKPATANLAEAQELKVLADANKVGIAINHNFVFSRPFNKLVKILGRGELGPIKSIRIVFKQILGQVTHGPWDLWMLREPGNVLFESGSHFLSEMFAVTDDPKNINVKVRSKKILPSGSPFFRQWNVTARSSSTFIQIDAAFDQGYEQHFVEVEGLFGVARADIQNDIFTVDQPTGRAYDVERLHVNCRIGISRVRQALMTYGSYAISKFVNSATGGPYETSMLNGIESCYREILGTADRRETSIDFAIKIARAAETIRAKMPKIAPISEKDKPIIPSISEAPSVNARVLIIGASGFIGKKLLTELQSQDLAVRALVRNASGLIGVKLNENSEVMVGDFRNEDVMDKALEGIEVVFHLAVAHSNSLAGYLAADSDPTLKFARQCRDKGVKRFIYTGTIDSLYLGPGAGLVRESDGVDPQIKRRNNYAHSKAITEAKLFKMYQDEGFPLVIIRPAIVLGAGGPVNHVGVANWFGLGRCAYWGKGENPLPIVLVEDIVKGLIAAMSAAGIEGNTYNLSAKPCISAREYVDEVEKVMGAKVIVFSSSYLKLFAGDFFKWIVKVLARHPDRNRIPSLRDWRCREQHATFDTTRAEQDLNWHPCNDREVIIEKGIREPTRLFLKG